MNIQSIIKEFKNTVSDEITIESQGLNNFRIITPFTYGDGDHFVIYLKLLSGNAAFLTDEGHTYMHLSYDDIDFWEGNRGRLLEKIKAEFQLRDDDGRLELAIPDKRYGDALFSYIQAVQKIMDIGFLSQERVRSTFMDDFRKLISNAIVNKERLLFNYTDPQFDPEGHYKVDASYLNGRQYHFFGIPNDDKCKVATIAIRAFREWYPPKDRPKPVGIFEDQTEMSSRPLAWFTDVCHKTYSTLSVAQKDLPDFLIEEGVLF